jgi:parallel beta-helix repeat protein
MRVLGSNVTIRNLNFGWTHHFSFTTDYFDPKGNGAGEVNALDVGGYYPTAKSNVLVDHVKVYGSWYSGIRPRYASHVTVRNCYVQQALATAIFPGDVIEDVVVDHCKTTDSKDDGIYIGVGKAHPAARNVKVIHCSVKNSWARGIGFGGVNGGLIEDNAIDNTYVAGITLDWSGSYSPEGTQNVIIRNNRIRNAGWNYKGMRAKFWARASSVPHGIYSFTGGTTGKIASIEIVSNEITHIRGSGIALAGLQRVSIRDNRITDATDGGTAIGFDASPNSRSVQDFTLSNNRIENVGGNGIYLSHASDGTVDDNTVRTYGKKGGRVDRGIMVYRCEGITLGSNEIANTHGAEERLTLNESRNVHQKPNTSSSNPR